MKDSDYKDSPGFYPRVSEQFDYWQLDKTPQEQSEPCYYYLVQKGDYDWHITPDGMSVEYFGDVPTGYRCITTNVTPRTLFPDDIRCLTEDHLLHLLNLPIEGRSYNEQEMRELYHQYLRETGGEEVH